jgi:hypothetical protein
MTKTKAEHDAVLDGAGDDSLTAGTPSNPTGATGADAAETVALTEEEAAEEEAIRAHAETSIRELVKLDLACRAQGHSLAQILAKTAQNVFGLDVSA